MRFLIFITTTFTLLVGCKSEQTVPYSKLKAQWRENATVFSVADVVRTNFPHASSEDIPCLRADGLINRGTFDDTDLLEKRLLVFEDETLEMLVDNAVLQIRAQNQFEFGQWVFTLRVTKAYFIELQPSNQTAKVKMMPVKYIWVRPSPKKRG